VNPHTLHQNKGTACHFSNSCWFILSYNGLKIACNKASSLIDITVKNLCNQSNHCEIMEISITNGTCLSQNWHYSQWAKMNRTQRRALVSPWILLCMHSGIGPEVTSNSKKIMPVTLAIVGLHLLKCIRFESISQSVENSVKQFLKNFVEIYWKCFGSACLVTQIILLHHRLGKLWLVFTLWAAPEP